MEELKKELKTKLFLLKVPKEVLDFLEKSKDNQVGRLHLFLNKKRRKKPEILLKFNKSSGPKQFSLNFKKTNDFFYFYDQEKKEDIKINNIDNFGQLIIKDEEESNQLIENIFNRETNKSKEIQIKPVIDGERKYKPQEEIKLSNSKNIDKNKKEKRVRIPDEQVIKIVRDIVPKNKNITPKEIADMIDVPENQVKEIMGKICDRMDDGTRKGYYKLKDDYEV